MSLALKLESELNNDQWLAIERGAYWLRADVDTLAESVLAIENEQEREMILCGLDALYFINTYCKILDPVLKDWIPFVLWDAQIDVLDAILANQLVVALKARQIGITWIALAVICWNMIFNPIAQILVFSRREEEATYLIGDERLRGMYTRLPDWMQTDSIDTDRAKMLQLSNGSSVRAFPSNSGDSYSATFALIDEAELVPDLHKLMNSVKPTIDAGGRLFMCSRSNKQKPNSLFKAIYRAAKQQMNNWTHIFLPWNVHPGRTQAWYDKQAKDIQNNTGSKDDLYEQYPTTDEEAMAAATLDKRIPVVWLKDCYEEMRPIDEKQLPTGVPSISGLNVYRLPEKGHSYVIGGDPAEGNETSDDSALCVLDEDTGEEVAALSGKLEPTIFATYMDMIGTWYNKARVIVERNNHGHAVIQWLQEHSKLTLVKGHDKKVGWLSNARGKALMYSNAADFFREEEGIIHSAKTFEQLASIERSTLKAPENMPDDCADAAAITISAIKIPPGTTWRRGSRW